MDARTVGKAFFLALTLVITSQGFVQAQDSLCPLEPVVIHLDAGQKVTISYHVNQGIEQDIVQVPRVTRRPFGASRVPSTTQSPSVTNDLDPYEGNATDVIHPSTSPPDFKDASNATESETTPDVISTTFESRNETEITAQPTNVTTLLTSTENIEYSATGNETIPSTETIVITEQTTITQIPSKTTITQIPSKTTGVQSTTKQSEELLTTTNENSDLSSSTAGNIDEKAQSTPEITSPKIEFTEEIPNENSTIEEINSTTEEINSTIETVVTSDLTTESVPTIQTTSRNTNVVVNDEPVDDDKAEEVTDESETNDEPITGNEDDFGGEVEDEPEIENKTTSSSKQFSTTAVTENIETTPDSINLISSSAPVNDENQTRVNESRLNDADKLDSNVTSTSTTVRNEVISTTTESQRGETIAVSDDANLTSIIESQTTEISNLSSVLLDEFEKALLANLTTLTQQEITESKITENEISTTVNQDLDELISNLTTTEEPSDNQELNDDEIFTNSTDENSITETTTDEFDEFEETDDNAEDESLLQPILDQILVNNTTIDESRDGREVESSNSTMSDTEDEPQYDEEIDEEGDEAEEEVAHADDTHSYADVVVPFGSSRDPDFVKRDTENLRSERWRRSPRYHVQPNITLCEWHFKAKPGVPLLLSFKNYSIDVSERCEEHHIAVRRSNGYVARWCGKAKESPSHTTFARQELHLLLYSENGTPETGFVAEIQALNNFLLRKAVNKVRPLFSAPH